MKRNSLASVIVVAEAIESKFVKEAIDNILDQTYKNVEIVVASYIDYEEEFVSYVRSKLLNVKFIKIEKGADNILKSAIDECSGDIVFYRTVTNVVWFPRHIEAHIENYNLDESLKWALSFIEVRDANNTSSTIKFRIDNPPDLDDVVLDEVSHVNGIDYGWRNSFISQGEGQPNLFVLKNALQIWANANNKGFVCHEITVIKFEGTKSESSNKEEIEKQIGRPKRVNIEDETDIVDGEIVIKRNFPTVVGSSVFQEYNKNILTNIEATDPDTINSIAIKRTTGMGDVILMEPIIKKLKQKYKNASITLYTNKSDIIKYFNHKPDYVEIIEENLLIQDVLHDKSDDIKFDFDLSYESRLGKPFIESYSEVCGIVFENEDDKKVQLINENEIEFDKKDKKLCIVCGDGSGWPGKEWGLEKYTAVISWLIDQGWEVIETGYYHTDITPSEYHSLEFDKMIDLISIADLYIGADNGPMHIARGYNIPCCIIAGAALPYYTNPNRDNIFYVQNNNAYNLGLKHKQFFNLSESTGSLTFIPIDNDEPTCGLRDIEPNHVIGSLEKFLVEDYDFNIPGKVYKKGDVSPEEKVEIMQRSFALK